MKKINFLLVILLLLTISKLIHPDAYDSMINRQEKELIELLNAKPHEIINGLQITIKPNKEQYSIDEAILIDCTFHNTSNESYFYRSGTINQQFSVLIWDFMDFIALQPGIIVSRQNIEKELTPGSSIKLTLQLQQFSLPQLNRNFPKFKYKYKYLNICVVSDAFYINNFSKIRLKSNRIKVKIVKS